MSEKMTKEQLMQMLPDHPELQEQLNAMTDEDLAEVTAGISLYESSEGINRDSWFVTLLMRILGRKPDQRSSMPQSQELQEPGKVPEPAEIVRGSTPQ